MSKYLNQEWLAAAEKYKNNLFTFTEVHASSSF
jgi:hypothetical protein